MSYEEAPFMAEIKIYILVTMVQLLHDRLGADACGNMVFSYSCTSTYVSTDSIKTFL